MKIRRASRLAVLATLFIALSACEPPETAIQDGVAARVGSAIISQAELDQALSRLDKLNVADPAQARSKVLEALIDQHLLSSQARQAELDKAPAVQLALQQAQRQVLAEAYMESLFKNLADPAESEIEAYYAQHPELFAQRKIYRVQELELQLDPERVSEVEAQLKQTQNLADLSRWLNEQGIDSKAGVVIKSAEQMPATLLAQLANMKDGQMVVVPTGGNRVSILQLQGSRSQPLTLEQAKGAIKRFLQSEKRKTLLEAEIRKLRAGSRVDYASGFAPVGESDAPTNQP